MTRLSINDLLPDTTYAIQIRAVGEGGEFSKQSVRHIFTTITDSVEPAVPTGLTWVAAGDSFHAEWNSISQNVDGEEISIVRYELQLTGATSRIVSVAATTGDSVSYDLSFAANKALFGSAQPSITAKVRSVDNKGLKSQWSDGVLAQNVPPAPPTNLSIRSSQDALSLGWDASTSDDVTGYNVYVGTVSGFTPSASNRIFSGLATATTYTTTNYSLHYFVVRSVDAFGQESTSVTGSGTADSPFVGDTTPPDVPGNFTGSITNNADGNGSRANLTWTITPPSDLVGFNIRWREQGTSVYSHETYDKDSRAASIALPKAHTTYEFEIRSADPLNYSNYSATLTLSGAANSAPSSVTGFSATPSIDSMLYRWNEVADSDLKDYEITFSTSATFASGNITFRAVGNSLTVSGLEPATTYYARIRSVDTGGLTSSWSATNTTATLAQLTPGDIGAPTTEQFNTAIKTYTPEYAVNQSETVAPTTGWSTATPTRNPGDYIWTRTIVTYQDNSTATSNPVLLTGNTGKGVSNTVVNYAKNTSGTTAPTTGWTTTVPTTVAGEFLWTRTVITYTDASTSTAYSVAAHGATGATGRGISSTAITYQKHTSGTTAPTGTWTTSIPATSPGEFLWTRTIITYTSGSPTTTTQYSVAAHGATGSPGSTGVSVTSITPYFTTTAAGAAAPAKPTTSVPSGAWTVTEPAYVSNTDLWRTDRVGYSDGSFSYTDVTKVSSYTAASEAITAANGKNKIIFSTSDASGTNYANGDIWYKKSGSDIIATWEFVSGAWAARTLRNEVISSLSAGKLVSGDITSASINLKSTGVIRSDNYVSNTSGWKLDAAGLEINNGVIKIGAVDQLQPELDNKAGLNYIQSRGTDLVTNGTGLLGNNTNFSWATFDPADAPTGAFGSFTSATNGTRFSDEQIAIDVDKKYIVSVKARQQVAGVVSRAYVGLSPLDSRGRTILPQHYVYQSRTMTTLSAPVNPGDTTITLSSVPSGDEWTRIPTYKYVGFWNWQDEDGKVWPQATYTRNVPTFTSISGNVVTLAAPYSGPALPAGTPVSRNYPGSNYMYTTMSNTVVPEVWTKFSSTIVSGVANGEQEATWGATTEFPPGTAFVKLLFLDNYGGANGGRQAFANISISDATAAYTAATSAQSSADNAFTRWAPTGATTIDGGKITTDSLDAIKIKAGTTFTQNLNVANTFTVGTASSNGIIQSYGYVANTTGWRLDKTTGLEINNGKVKASTLIGGTLGSSTGSIQVAAGANLVFNGGYLKSNTYTGTSYSATAGAGWYLGNDGLRIASGSISASALDAGTITGTKTITLSGANAKIVATNFELSGSGLTLANGSLNAAALNITSQFGNDVVAATTVIDGGKINTGMIQSTQPALDADGVAVPGIKAWQIDLEGDAVLGNAWIRGNLTVGQSGDSYTSVLQSSNYVPGVSGWRLDSQGIDLLGVTAQSINGAAIATDTLSPATLAGGEMNSVIKLQGILQATGNMGELVRFGSHGFDVIGPNEAVVTAASRTTTTVTITTQSNHGYAVGSEIFVDSVGEEYDGIYTIATVPALNQLTYAKSGATGTATVSDGIVYGLDTENPVESRQSQPVYVEFPSTVAKPNIISGVLQAKTLSVLKGATFRGTVGIEVGSVFSIASAILAPTDAPTVTASYDQVSLSTLNLEYAEGITVGHNGNLFVSGSNYYNNRTVIEEFNSSGTRIQSITKGTDNKFRSGYGITYFNNNYYVLENFESTGGNAWGNDLVRYDTSFNEVQRVDLGGYGTMGDPMGATIGWNYAENRLIMAAHYTSTWSGNASGRWIIEWNIDPTTGAIGTVFSQQKYTTLNGIIDFPAFIAKGTFGYAGTSRYIIRDTATSTGYKDYQVFTPGTGTLIPSDNWPSASSQSIGGAAYRPVEQDFVEVTLDCEMRFYAGGDSFWTSTDESVRWVANSYFRSSDSAETTLSPLKKFVLPKRAKMSITITGIPGGTSSSLPDSSCVYIAKQDSQPAPTGSIWKNFANITYPATTVKINPKYVPGAKQPVATSTFAQDATPGEIRTTSGNSYWRGDDTAKFYQLILTASEEADGSVDNTPALRIGDTNGQHLRVDSNEILAMNDNTLDNFGRLGLNQGAFGAGEIFCGSPLIANQGLDMRNNKIFGVVELESSSSILIDVPDGGLLFDSGTGVAGRLKANFTGTASVTWQNDHVIIGGENINGTPGAGNTKDLYCYRVRAFASYVNSSDGRLKSNISPLSGGWAMDKVKQIPIKSYFREENPDKIEYGIVAQELAGILPDAVQKMTADEADGMYGITYQDVWALGFAATKEIIRKLEIVEDWMGKAKAANNQKTQQIADLDQRLTQQEQYTLNLHNRLSALESV